MYRVRNVIGKLIFWILVPAFLCGIQKVQAAAGHSNGTIIHAPVKHVAEGEPIVIESEFMGPIAKASVYYRLPGDPAFMEMPMVQKMNGKYSARLKLQPLKKGDLI